MVLGEPGLHPHALSAEAFDGLFGVDTPVVINYHGYPGQVKALLFERTHHITRKRVCSCPYCSHVCLDTKTFVVCLRKLD